MADQTPSSGGTEEKKQDSGQTTPPATDAPKAEAPAEEKPAGEQPQPANQAAETTAEGPASADKPAEPAAAVPPPGPKKPSKKLFIIGGVVVFLLLLVVIGFMSSSGSQQNQQTATNQTTNEDNLQPTKVEQKEPLKTDITNPQAFSRMFVYGSWSGQTSNIKAVELSTQTTKVLASLPSSIKKVSIVSPEKLLYIDKTDKRDHGKQLTIYNIKTKAPLTSIPASQGYGIDDYVLSPDRNFIAIWEVSFAQNSEVLMGGKSRVYTVDLKRPSVKNLIYDEKSAADAPVHYPRAILNDGRVFADKFLPNDPKGGAGWAYGLSAVEFDGTNKQDLQQMPHGSYGTQPVLSPDGKYLVFSGYDGSKGDGKTSVGGYRQAILTPNTVEVLDTKTLNRQKLPNLDNTNIYSSSAWDISSGKIIITVIAQDKTKSGVFSYDLQTNQLTRINIPDTEKTTYGFLSAITDNTSIIGTQDTNASNLGNLGENYAFPFTQVLLLDVASSKVSFVPLEDTFAQYITVLPGDYFKNVLGLQAHAQELPTQPELPKPTFVDLFSLQNDTKARQQLYTFFVKYDLSSIRTNQQSTPLVFSAIPSGGDPGDNTDMDIQIPPGFKQNKNSPKCEELAEQQCSEQQGNPASPGDDTMKDCVRTNKVKNLTGAKFEGKCHDSPLYLYGPEGKQVAVSIQTPISKAIPSGNGSYDVTLGQSGTFFVNGKSYSKIAYDYISNLRKVTPPKTGTIVHRSGVENVLKEYAQKLGLNSLETADLLAAGRLKVTGEYAFVSFFDQKTSQAILPISFDPQPDNYLNVVFYFKNLAEKPYFTPLPPTFPEPISRTGFTAVEVSEMVE